MTPLQFVTRQRIARAQQLIRETSRSQIEIALEVGYTSPSQFRAGLPAGNRPYAERLPAAEVL
jgi:AraC-like DNA-binding protein